MIGFDVTHRMGDQAAFLSAGGYHHHIGLNTWESKGGSPPPPGTTGLFHVAVRFPDRRDAGRGVAAGAGGRNPARRRLRSRRQRGALPARPGRKRRRALLRPPARGLADGDVHGAARRPGSSGRSGQRAALVRAAARCGMRYTLTADGKGRRARQSSRDPFRRGLRRRDAADRSGVRERDGGARKRPFDLPGLPRRDPRARRVAARCLGLPDPLRRPRHPHAGRSRRACWWR